MNNILQIIRYAQKEAQNMGHNFVAPLHLLLGLLHNEEDPIVQELNSLGVNLNNTRAEVENFLSKMNEDVIETPFTPKSTSILSFTPKSMIILNISEDKSISDMKDMDSKTILLKLIKGDKFVNAILIILGMDIEKFIATKYINNTTNKNSEKKDNKFSFLKKIFNKNSSLENGISKKL